MRFGHLILNRAYFFFIGSLSFFIAPGLLAQTGEQTILIGEQTRIYSSLLQENRDLLIHFPPSYSKSKHSYPTLYLLDGETHFQHLAALVDYLAGLGRIPEMLVVALPNTNRNRDLTPPSSSMADFYPDSGGGNRFLDFFDQELIPHIERTYRVNPYRIIAGHSFGGLLVINSLSTHPELFNAYLASSPSLWWDQQSVIDALEVYFKVHWDKKGQVFFSLGNETGKMLSSSWKLAAILEEIGPKELAWSFRQFPEESHGSVPHQSFYHGLKVIFPGWNLPGALSLYQQKGLAPIEQHYSDLSSTFGFPVSIPEPTLDRISWWLLDRKQIDKALQLFQRNVAEYPGSGAAHFSLGVAYFRNGELEQAQRHLERCLELDPANEAATKWLATVNKQKK